MHTVINCICFPDKYLLIYCFNYSSERANHGPFISVGFEAQYTVLVNRMCSRWLFRVFNDDTKLLRLFHSGFISFTAIINFMILSFVLSSNRP